MTAAYYNERDPFAAAWLRELIAAGHIAPGTVDERDIRDVRPDELVGYVQCHFFAGIGGWSRALRLTGWPDDRPVWTGSCPCQPFSAAGKRSGFADERHLWPAWHWLIQQSRPDVVFGEQVASQDGLGWLDLVQTDLEGIGYTCGPGDLPVAGLTVADHPLVGKAVAILKEYGRRFILAGNRERASEVEAALLDIQGIEFGVPHIRQRLWFVAHRNGAGLQVGVGPEGAGGGDATEPRGAAGGVADPTNPRCDGAWQHGGGSSLRTARPEQSSTASGMEHATGERCGEAGRNLSGQAERLGGFWSDADWLPCTDGKARPVEPGTFPLASGVPARVGRLRGYGNAIVPQVAAEFIRAFAEGGIDA